MFFRDAALRLLTQFCEPSVWILGQPHVTSPWNSPRILSLLAAATAAAGALLAAVPNAGAEPPPNDHFADAADLGSVEEVTVNGTLAEATVESGEVWASMTRSVWYTWVAPADSPALVTVDDISNLHLVVYRGSSLSDLVGTPHLRTQEFTAIEGERYFIYVAGHRYLELDDFTLELITSPPPANDDFASREDLGTLTDFIQAANPLFGATTEPDEPWHLPPLYNARPGSSGSIWWSFESGFDGVVDATLAGRIHRGFAVYHGEDLASLTSVVKEAERLVFGVAAGQRYHIAAAGSAKSIELTLTRSPIPHGNDLFENRASLPGNGPHVLLGHTFGAGMESWEASRLNPQRVSGRSIWWEWIAPSNRQMYLDLNNDFDVWTGTPPNLTPVLPKAFGPNWDFPTFTPTAGKAYYIRARTFEPPPVQPYLGAYTPQEVFTSALVPEFSLQPHDDLADALDLGSPMRCSVADSIRRATGQADEPGLANPRSSLWYRWTPPFDGVFAFGAAPAVGSSVFNFVVHVLKPAPAGGLISVASSVPSSRGAFCSAACQAGVPLFVQVASKATVSADTFELSIAPAILENDTLARAIVLPSETAVRIDGATIGAGPDAFPAEIAGQPAARTVWYRWTASETMDYELRIGGSQTVAAVFAASDEADEFSSVVETDSRAPFQATAGASYVVAIDSPLEQKFTAVIEPFQPDDIDLFVMRKIIEGAPARDHVTCCNGSVEDHEEIAGARFGASYWWEWWPPEDGYYRISASTMDAAVAVAAYRGTSAGDLQLVSLDDRSILISASSEASVAISALLSSPARCGLVTIEIEAISFADVPPNDRFDNRERLQRTLPAAFDAKPFQAGREPYEPIHDDQQAGGGTLWWEWTAPQDGLYQILWERDKFYDTGIFVYGMEDEREPRLDGLALIDQHALYTYKGPVNFVATAGRTYFMALAASYARQGESLTFTLQRAAETRNDMFSNRAVLPDHATVTLSGTLFGAALEDAEPSHAGPGGSVWFEWTPPTSGPLPIPTGAGWSISVYQGEALADLQLVSGDNNWFWATSGSTYQIAVTGTTSAVTDFAHQLAVLNLPENDDFINRIDLGSEKSLRVEGHTYGASVETNEPNLGRSDMDASTWWEWTAATDGSLIVTKLSGLYGITPVIAPIDDSDDVKNLVPSRMWSGYRVAAGQRYAIGFFSFGGNRGDASYRIDLYRSSLNHDHIAQARPLISVDGVAADESHPESLSFEPGELEAAPLSAGAAGSLWWRWEAEHSGIVEVTLETASALPRLCVYEGAALDELSPVGFGVKDGPPGPTRAVFPAKKGQSYSISAGLTAASSAAITLVHGPSNDTIAEAQDWGNAESAETEVELNFASWEPGEPYGNSDVVRVRRGFQTASAWWRWTAPRGGEFLLACPAGDDLHPYASNLAVFAAPEAPADGMDGPIASGFEAMIFSAEAGAAYMIAAYSSGLEGMSRVSIEPAEGIDFAAWIAGAAPGSAEADREPAADANGNGIANLVEYLVGAGDSDTDGVFGRLPSARIDEGGKIVIEFILGADRPSARWELEALGAEGDWRMLRAGTDYLVITNDRGDGSVAVSAALEPTALAGSPDALAVRLRAFLVAGP